VSAQPIITARFHAPPDDLRRFFTTFYVTEVTVPDGEEVTDALQPEWANLRFFAGRTPVSWFDSLDPVANTDFTATGPSSRPAGFRLGTSRFWGVGLLPLGWSQFMRLSATDHVNLVADGYTHPSFARFAPLARSLFDDRPDDAAEYERLVAFFRGLVKLPTPDEQRITEIHAALVDPQVASVAQLVDRVGTSQRTIERICHRAFGFSPKLLLRRQRFMRSLAQFMLDPSLKWIGAIDWQYHDQAQFVRDFHEFMGMTPREYANTPHPVLEKFIQMRARVAGAAVQTLDAPGGSAAPAPFGK
jgi:AraC-like DNA-binding protein